MRVLPLTLLAALLAPGALFGSQADAALVARMKQLAFERRVEEARKLVESRRDVSRPKTPEWPAALSWMARGASFVEDWETARRYAEEAYEGSLALLSAGRGVDSSAHLATALGASIEVLSRAMDAEGDRGGAVRFLREERRNYAGTSIETRIRKNLLLIDLEGKPMPKLAAERYLSKPAPRADELRGKVALFFFWAHWCSDCKQQHPILERLHVEYFSKGLVIVGPTRLYGYTAGGVDATPAEEIAYIEGPYQKLYPTPEWMSIPLSKDNFINFGVSTTPTLVLVDREGIVRLYHPGGVSYEELAAKIEALLQESVRREISRKPSRANPRTETEPLP